jgi:glycerol-3-phosphate acyltransferase PlsY
MRRTPGYAALLVAAYLIGSLPVGYAVAKWRRGVDLREVGTGNVGASNTWRNVGRAAGVGVALANILQSMLPTVVALSLGYSRLAAGLVGFAAAVGYAWPVFFRFSGGRAVAATGGVMLTLWTVPTLVLGVFFWLGMLVRKNPLTMFVGFGALPVYLRLVGYPLVEVGLAAGLYVFLLARRLVGIQDDLRDADRPLKVFVDRLVHDRRPGQTEYGPHRIGRAWMRSKETDESASGGIA